MNKENKPGFVTRTYSSIKQSKKDFIRNMYMKYQRAYWLITIASGEIGKPTIFMTEVLMVMTFLKVNFGITTRVPYLITIYALLLIAGVVLGKMFLNIGVVKYNAHLGNSQNEAIQKILKYIEKQEK